jgi:hypothetical protein
MTWSRVFMRYFSHHVPLRTVSLFYVKQLCFICLRSLESLGRMPCGIDSFPLIFAVKLRIPQLPCCVVIDQLPRANAQ